MKFAMIFLNSLCLHSRHHILLRSRVSLTPINVLSRASSLSAIHRGLRDSQKSRPQGFNKSSLRPTGSRNPPRRADFKITKGKKDITNKDIPGTKSRAARFHDPNDSFGKKSLVYQAKQVFQKTRTGSDRMSPAQFMNDFHGGSERPSGRSPAFQARDSRTTRDSIRSPSVSRNFEDKFARPRERRDFAASSQDESPHRKYQRPNAFRPASRERFDKPFDKPFNKSSDQSFEKSFSKPFVRRDSAVSSHDDYSSHRKFQRPDANRSASRENFNKSFDKPFNTSFDTRDSTRRWNADRQVQKEWPSREAQGRTEDARKYRPSREQNSGEDGVDSPIRRIEKKDHDRGPVRIPRTTAASQFLYGKSVVDAALRQTTRKLYKLYIYCGENRQDESQIAFFRKLAFEAKVPVIEVMDSDGLRRMDKMSEGRPHNGCVLEASPLPQLPVKALGPMGERGFFLKLGYQSAEEAEINGTDNFVRCDLPPGRLPFVLLLDRIQDPGNLGAILRTAAFLGVSAVGITKGHSATLNSIASKSSAGASEVMKLFTVDSILDFLTRSKEDDWVIYAAVAPTGYPRGNKHLSLDRVETYDPLSNFPTILVMGSEGEGITRDTRRLADFEVSIPNQSVSPLVESLNVSVATGILCSAFLKKQHIRDSLTTVPGSGPKENDSQSEAESLW
ncbi:hypothetical protein F5B19DRAFT_456611 [Rostrohypoxylon terebratum]|nr:hypothetical protein F5B19DRAFT_456611 [Rostrohypoxylon terebratum]